MRFFGHPIHIMLVHFPAALFPFELLCAFLGFYTGEKTFASASFFAMTGGVILGWIAIVFGVLDLLKVVKEKPDAVKTAVIHASINTCVIIVYTVLAYSKFKVYPAINADTLPILILKAVTIITMFAGNYLGGSLILKYKVAVEK